jgi:hypothetical protein
MAHYICVVKVQISHGRLVLPLLLNQPPQQICLVPLVSSLSSSHCPQHRPCESQHSICDQVSVRFTPHSAVSTASHRADFLVNSTFRARQSRTRRSQRETTALHCSRTIKETHQPTQQDNRIQQSGTANLVIVSSPSSTKAPTCQPDSHSPLPRRIPHLHPNCLPAFPNHT